MPFPWEMNETQSATSPRGTPPTGGYASPAPPTNVRAGSGTPRSRNTKGSDGKENPLLGAIRREVESSEERMTKRMDRIEKQFNDFREGTLATIDRKLQEVNAWQPQVAKQMAELTGGLTATKDELPSIVLKISQLETRLWEAHQRVEEACKAQAAAAVDECKRHASLAEQKLSEPHPLLQDDMKKLSEKVDRMQTTSADDLRAYSKLADQMLADVKRFTADMENKIANLSETEASSPRGKFVADAAGLSSRVTAVEASVSGLSQPLDAYKVKLEALDKRLDAASLEQDGRLKQAEDQLIALAKAVASPAALSEGAATGASSAVAADQGSAETQAKLQKCEHDVRIASEAAEKSMEAVKALATKLRQTFLQKNDFEDRLHNLEAVVSDHDVHLQHQLQSNGRVIDSNAPRETIEGLWRDVESQESKLKDMSTGLDELRVLLSSAQAAANKDLQDLRLGLNEVSDQLQEVTSRSESKDGAGDVTKAPPEAGSEVQAETIMEQPKPAALDSALLEEELVRSESQKVVAELAGPTPSPGSSTRQRRSYRSASDLLNNVTIDSDDEDHLEIAEKLAAAKQTHSRAALDALDEAWEATGLATGSAGLHPAGTHSQELALAEEAPLPSWGSLIRSCLIGLTARPKPGSTRAPVEARF